MTSKIEQRRETGGNASWIDPHRKRFLEQLAVEGYSIGTKRSYERIVDRFCTELGKRSAGEPEAVGIAIEAIQQEMLDEKRGRVPKHAKFRLERFIEHLVDAGIASLPQPPPKKPTAMEALRAEFGGYLRRQRGLSESTIYHCLRCFERFMIFRFGEEFGDLNAITPDNIVSFLRQFRTGPRPYRGKTPPSHLRNLFQFLFWSGKTERNLANCIPSVAHPQPTNLPRYLKPDEIQRLIEAARSDDAMGRRNYAMLLLQARLGLRAFEVIAIQLEDIDWRGGEILIRGKGQLHDRMPLSAELGEAIVDYIRNRRVGISRALFVSHRAPHQAFKDGQIVNGVLKKALKKTGLKPPQKYVGSHLLRHSLATTLLREGASLEEVSHVLRHRSRVTTMIYAKYDIGALKSIAQPWPLEEGRVQ